MWHMESKIKEHWSVYSDTEEEEERTHGDRAAEAKNGRAVTNAEKNADIQ